METALANPLYARVTEGISQVFSEGGIICTSQTKL